MARVSAKPLNLFCTQPLADPTAMLNNFFPWVTMAQPFPGLWGTTPPPTIPRDAQHVEGEPYRPGAVFLKSAYLGPTPVLLEPETPAAHDVAPTAVEPSPTVGSEAHFLGTCKPCVFIFKEGCNSGAECKFCHLCDAEERKRRKKQQKMASARRSALRKVC